MLSRPSIAIVCDWLVSRGGAERVIRTLADIFPEAPIFTTIYDEKRLSEFRDREVRTSFLQKMPFSKSKHYALLPLMPYAVEQFDLSAFDIVISSSHSCAKGIITKPKTLHICYCHSPMRYCWDGCHDYFNRFGVPWLLRRRAQKMLHELRLWDRLAADRVDIFIANSKHVQSRISKYYRRESTVIYPPVDTARFSGPVRSGQYFLALGRLTPYKRFDLLVDCFNDLALPLIIVGTGKEEKKLRKRAGRFITFLGAVNDNDIVEIYKKAFALVFPQAEDFGITPIEAMSAGKPVIAFGEGGALETVIDGKTGVLFFEQTVESLKTAVLHFQKIAWNVENIQKHAQKFDRAIFEKNMSEFVLDSWGEWKKNIVT